MLGLLLVAASLVSGQNTFNRRVHLGSPAAIATGVIATDTCYYVTGIVADTLFPYKSGNFFMKLGLDGEVIFDKWLVDSVRTYETWLPSFQVTLDTDFINCGYSFGGNDKNMMIVYDNDGAIKKLFKYSHHFEDGLFTLPRSITGNNSSGYLIVSEQKSNEGLNNSEIVLTKINSGGEVEYETYYGSSINERPNEIHALSSNYFIISGRRNNTNTNDFDYRSYDYLLAIDSLGNVLWDYESWPSFELRQGANSLVATDDGGLVVASGRGEEFYINSSSGGLRWKSGLIYKLNAAREVEWEVEFKDMRPDILYNRLNKLIAIRDGSGYVATGHFLEEYPGGQTFDIHGWIVKVSPDGDSLWSRRLRYFEDVGVWQKIHLLNDIKETSDGGFIMVGEANNQNAMLQRQQAWLIKVDEHGCLVPGCHLVGVEEEPGVAQPEVQVMLSPNPAREYVNVFIKDERIAQRRGAQVRVFDSQGRERLRRPAGRLDEVTNMIPVWDWPGGWYVLVYEDAGGVLWEGRFVVGE